MCDFRQIWDPLGTKDYSFVACEKFRIFRILADILNLGGNGKWFVSKTVRDISILVKFWTLAC